MKHSKYQATKIGYLIGEDISRVLPEYDEVIPLKNKSATFKWNTTKEIKPMTTKSAYRVLKNNRVATKTTFSSYEQARQWVRSKLRRSITNTGARRAVMWDGISRNPPSINHFGYAIRKVA